MIGTLQEVQFCQNTMEADPTLLLEGRQVSREGHQVSREGRQVFREGHHPEVAEAQI